MQAGWQRWTGWQDKKLCEYFHIEWEKALRQLQGGQLWPLYEERELNIITLSVTKGTMGLSRLKRLQNVGIIYLVETSRTYILNLMPKYILNRFYGIYKVMKVYYMILFYYYTQK